jgi:hypothetical protein
MVISSDLMRFHGDLIGFHEDFMVIWWEIILE